MYDHLKQYKCTIIRARAISECDDLLPKYATIIDTLCPCTRENFDNGFDEHFRIYAKNRARDKDNQNAIQKTINNHKTEISGSLFGMHYEIDGIVYASERTKKLLFDNDQPAFFKDWLYKMQFPNGMQKSQTYKQHIDDGIKCRPYSFLMKVLLYLKSENVSLLKQEIGYYILNSEDVLKGRATPLEVAEQIIKDKKECIYPRSIVIPEDASSSYDQHIGDQLKYLELSNLLIIDGQNVKLNVNEEDAIYTFANEWSKPLPFDVNLYKLEDLNERKKFEENWAIYYSSLSTVVDKFTTTYNSLDLPVIKKETNDKFNAVELGDEGEAYVLAYEINRVRLFNSHLVRKVIPLGKTKGLGYDIQSVIAEKGEMSEFVKYIEVKSTKRVTAPDVADSMWIDTLNITRNEWIAAQQHKEYYSIYRVYFTRDGVFMFVIENVQQKEKDGLINVVPTTYRVDFNNSAVKALSE